MLEIEIEKSLPGFHLQVSFAVGEEPVALFGPSGAGKTLTLQCIAGLLRPDSGRIAVGGVTLFDSARGIDLPPQARRIGLVFQNYALFPHLTVEQNVSYGAHYVPTVKRKQRVEALIRLMWLQGLEKRRPSQLSGGQQQRVALARALAADPRALLMDEPLAALDSVIRSRLRTELPRLLQTLGIPVMLVTHNLEDAYAMSRRIVVYCDGRVLQVGTWEDVVRRPRTRTVARFTGAKNIFRGVVSAVHTDRLELEGEGLRVVAPLYCRTPGQAVEFCVRPEDVMLVRPDRLEPPTENCFLCEIVGEVPHGDILTLLVRIVGSRTDRDYDIQIEIPSLVYRRLKVAEEKRWDIYFKREAVHLLEPEGV